MRCDDAGTAGLSEREDGLGDGFLSAEIEGGRGLIEQECTAERFRKCGERHREVRSLLFAAG